MHCISFLKVGFSRLLASFPTVSSEFSANFSSQKWRVQVLHLHMCPSRSASWLCIYYILLTKGQEKPEHQSFASNEARASQLLLVPLLTMSSKRSPDMTPFLWKCLMCRIGTVPTSAKVPWPGMVST